MVCPGHELVPKNAKACGAADAAATCKSTGKWVAAIARRWRKRKRSSVKTRQYLVRRGSEIQICGCFDPLGVLIMIAKPARSSRRSSRTSRLEQLRPHGVKIAFWSAISLLDRAATARLFGVWAVTLNRIDFDECLKKPGLCETMTIRLHRGDLPGSVMKHSLRWRSIPRPWGCIRIATDFCVVQDVEWRTAAPTSCRSRKNAADAPHFKGAAGQSENHQRFSTSPGLISLALYNAFGVTPLQPVYCTKIASRLTRTYT